MTKGFPQSVNRRSIYGNAPAWAGYRQAVHVCVKEKLDGKPIALKAWKQEYAQLKTEYAELSPQHKPLREEVIRLRQVQNAVDTALRRREQPQAVQRKKHEMEL